MGSEMCIRDSRAAASRAGVAFIFIVGLALRRSAAAARRRWWASSWRGRRGHVLVVAFAFGHFSACARATGAALLLAGARGVFGARSPLVMWRALLKNDERRSLRRACVYLARQHAFLRELSALLAASRGPKSGWLCRHTDRQRDRSLGALQIGRWGNFSHTCAASTLKWALAPLNASFSKAGPHAQASNKCPAFAAHARRVADQPLH